MFQVWSKCGSAICRKKDPYPSKKVKNLDKAPCLKLFSSLDLQKEHNRGGSVHRQAPVQEHGGQHQVPGQHRSQGRSTQDGSPAHDSGGESVGKTKPFLCKENIQVETYLLHNSFSSKGGFKMVINGVVIYKEHGKMQVTPLFGKKLIVLYWIF